MEISADKFGQILFIVYWAIWGILALRPRDRRTWWLESVTPVVIFPFLFWINNLGLLSKTSSIIILIFALLHVTAARYVYASMPFGNWIKKRLSLGRNNYDRFVHFSYGVLMVPVFYSLLSSFLPEANILRSIFAFTIVVSVGSVYEILEYAAAIMFGKNDSAGFLGMQGDIWDTQKDMLAQTIGALISLLFLIS
ncbi:MAG TPA: DUF2238 domain-containing protein [Candidatus Paceibacterota bacterium]